MLFDGPPRKSESDITEREVNLPVNPSGHGGNRSAMAKFLRETTNRKNLCLAGGVA